MQYFQAVQIGRQRANKAQMALFEIAGFSMLTLTTKKIDGKFFPVGEESLVTVIKIDNGYVTIYRIINNSNNKRFNRFYRI